MKTRKHLKIARITAELSQYDLAKIVGVSQQTIAKWERGTTTPAQFSHLRIIESALDEPADKLFPDIFNKNKVMIDM